MDVNCLAVAPSVAAAAVAVVVGLLLVGLIVVAVVVVVVGSVVDGRTGSGCRWIRSSRWIAGRRTTRSRLP